MALKVSFGFFAKAKINAGVSKTSPGRIKISFGLLE